jgi:hypothetical protein
MKDVGKIYLASQGLKLALPSHLPQAGASRKARTAKGSVVRHLSMERQQTPK